MAPRTLIRDLDIRTRIERNDSYDKTEENLFRGRYFEADCDASLVVGETVRFQSPLSDPVVRVKKSVPAGNVSYGVVIEKITSTRCFVLREGVIAASTLGLAAPTANTDYWVGSTGTLVTTPPTPVTGTMFVQLAGRAINSSEILIFFNPYPPKKRA